MSHPPLIIKNSPKIDYHRFISVFFFKELTSNLDAPVRKGDWFCNCLYFVVFIMPLILWSWCCGNDCQRSFKTVVRREWVCDDVFVNAAKLY